MTSDSSNHDQPRRSIGARRNPQTQQAILDAAEVIIEADLASFSIEAVARKARAGKPTIYRWWPSKAALLLDVYRRQKPMQVHFDTGSIERDVALYLFRLIGHWRDTGAGAIFRFVLAEAQHDPSAATALADYSAAHRAQTTEIFARGITRGQLALDTNAALAAETISAFAWHRLLTGQLETDPEELQAVARQIVRGLLPPGP